MTIPPPKPTSAVDTECYRDYWLCMFETGEVFEQWPGQPLDRQGLANALARYQCITFNGRGYDMPLITLALQGATCEQLKQASNAIIVYGTKPWEIAEPPDWIDHIDLMEVAPGGGSLKMYGGKMHSRRLQDLPFDEAASIAPAQRPVLRTYCANDLATTRDLYNAMAERVALRERMGGEYRIDLRSKSDAQIAEAVMKQLLAFYVQRPSVQYGQRFYYRPPAWLDNATPAVAGALAMLARSPFTIGANGSPVMTEELAATRIRIGASEYQMGSGGLHSCEHKITHVATEHEVLSDHDVASYYPALILNTGIVPEQIGPAFQTIYAGWFRQRIEAKRAGKKSEANSRKIVLNGTFGKLGSPWSIFYAPAEMIQVTITGQLALLMLIERFELCGIRVVSANTDGIVVKCLRSMLWLRDEVVRWWEGITGFETERTEYRLLASRDVNSYVAIKTDGEVKTKGAYAPPEPGPSGWPNPTTQIAVDACVAWLRDRTPVATTIRACTDVRQFVSVRNVKGGGSFAPLGQADKGATQKHMRATLGAWAEGVDKLELLSMWAEHCEQVAAQRQYLGKAVRWYYAKGSPGCIVTPTGGLVAKTQGCRPLMELPDALPTDVDYEWYEAEARALIEDLGFPTNGS